MSRRSLAMASGTVLLIFLSLIFADRATARELPLKLTLEDAMTRAAARPRAEAADLRARSAELQAEVSRRAGRWPTVGVAADLTHRDRDYDFETPLGAFTLGDRTSTSLTLQITQPLFDPVRRRYTEPSARSAAEAARAMAARTRQELAAEAAAGFIRVLEIDAALASTDAFVSSLQARLDEMQARVEAGRVLEADALKIRLDLDAAELDSQRWTDLRRVAVADLGRLVGLDEGSEPDFAGDVDRGQTPELDAAVEAALFHRPDIAVLEAQIRALELQAGAVRAEKLPRVEAQLSYQRADGDPFRPEDLATGAVLVSWSPFAAGTRSPRAAASTAEAEALRADLAELRRGIRMQLVDALARLETSRSAVLVRQRGVELASETLRVERERHGAGRSTTNDLLDAEATLRRQRTEHDLARFEVLRAWISLDLATGRWAPGSWTPGS